MSAAQFLFTASDLVKLVIFLPCGSSRSTRGGGGGRWGGGGERWDASETSSTTRSDCAAAPSQWNRAEWNPGLTEQFTQPHFPNLKGLSLP